MISLFSLDHWCHFRILAAWVGQLLAKKQTLAMPICSCGSRKPATRQPFNPFERVSIIQRPTILALQLELNTNTFRSQKKKKSARIKQQTCLLSQFMLRWTFFDTKILKQTHAYVTTSVPIPSCNCHGEINWEAHTVRNLNTNPQDLMLGDEWMKECLFLYVYLHTIICT